MKTKKILFATALVASFASCTNDDIVEVQQGIATANRPTVENVNLNFVGDGPESRLVYNGDYAWQSTDIIGALLMDAPYTPEEATGDKWYDKYQLVNYVNTSYPFTYNPETKMWGNDAKMLEGNYFFAYPWSSYDGARSLVHSLKKQTQTGVASSTVAKSFADNQFLLGYSKIKAGTDAVDALDDVAMTPILGGIQFRIINNGTKTYHINKIVVKGEGIDTELTIDPTDFIVANYVGDDKGYDYNAELVEAEDFERAELLRELVTSVEDGDADLAQLSVNGTKAQRAIAKGATGYAVVMLNADDAIATGELKADIYTDEGVIKDIDLTNTMLERADVLVDKAVTKIGFTITNTVSIKFKDDAIQTILSAEIVDNEDLLQLIEWNQNSDIKVTPVATLVGKDVELTAEMFNLLKSNENVTLTINADDEEVLTLAAGLPADVLEYEGLVINTAVNVAGEIDLTKDTPAISAMTVLEDAVVNVDDAKAKFPTAMVNEGTMNFGENCIAQVTLTNEKKGIINVAKGADVKGAEKASFVNNGKINNNGYVEHITNAAEGIITLGENAALKDLDNNAEAEVNTANGIQLTGTNAGLINYVSGANINLTENTGMVSAEAPVAVAKDQYEGSCVNTLTLVPGQITTFNDASTGGIENVIMTKGSTLKVANKVALVLSEIIVKENSAIITNTTAGENASSVTAATMTVKEDVELTNNGSYVVTTTWSNEGIVYNNGSATLPDGETAETWGVFKYTMPNAGVIVDTSKATALQALIVRAIDKSGHAATLENVQLYVNNTKGVANRETLHAEAVAFEKANGNSSTIDEDDFNAALAAIKTANASALKTALLANDVTLTAATLNPTASTLFQAELNADGTIKTSAKAKAYNVFKANVISAAANLPSTVKPSVKLAASELAEADIDAILAAKAPYAFIWTDCNLDKAVAIWKKYDGVKVTGNSQHDYTEGIDAEKTNARFVLWAEAVMKTSEYATIKTELATCGVALDTYVSFGNYSPEQFKACAE